MSNPAFIITLVFLDLLSFYMSFALAYITRGGLNLIFPQLPVFDIQALSLLKLIWIPAILITLLGYEGLYTKRQNFWLDTKDITKTIFFSLIVVLAIITLSKITHEVSRLFVVLMFVYCLFIIPIVRRIFKRFIHKKGIWIEKVILICNYDEAENLIRLIEQDFYLGYKVGVIFSNIKGKIYQGKEIIKVYNSLKWLKRVSQIIGSNTAFVSIKNDKSSEISLHQIQMMIKNIYVFPDINLITHLKTEIIPLLKDDVPLLYIKNNLKEPINTILKATFDYIFSLIILPFFIPIVVILALLIKIDSKGPVFFTQNRVGKGGIHFRVFKFRTMYVDNQERLKVYLKLNPEAKKEMEEFCKLKDDPRVTKIGKFLRKTSLDELPQVMNILRGEMSFVGPRPAFKEELENYYGDLQEFYKEVKPGITGLWQVSGRNQLTMKDRARLEAFYVINWSLWLDIVILLKTIKVVLKKEGAY
ncbi:MAG: undecaprenyl-phosphate galactose phosphotransferase WbaP [Thermodesulfovibrionales bacterium]|nr:undecaprenyl-phosphate galactose phosphotransferase WbaP [Thermodesulfovibrionales bacterium]